MSIQSIDVGEAKNFKADEGGSFLENELLLFWCGPGLPLMLMWSGGLQNMERWPRRHAARYQISYFTTRAIQRVVQNIYPRNIHKVASKVKLPKVKNKLFKGS